ncbi:MAG: NYN domain-containing protein [Nitrospinota bacterium]
MKLLIDGYNVIPAIPELGRKLRSDLEEGRDAFLSLLGEYKRASSAPLDITVIFDGKRNPGGDTAMRIHGIGVRFSRNEIADDLILRLLKNEMWGATLVTSDRGLRDAAEPMAGALVRSGEFADRLLLAMEEGGGEGETAERPTRHSTKKKGNPRRLSKKERVRQRSLKNL